MKTILLGILASVLLVGCYSSDDYNDRSVQLRVDNAIQFDNEEEYSVGDTLYFQVGFSRYLEEDGFSTLLDVFETTNDEQFGFSFQLDKYSDFSNRYESVFIDQELIIGPRGDDANFFGDSMVVELNDARDAYTAEVGIVLTEIGDFQLDFDFLNFAPPFGDDNKVRVFIEYIPATTSTLNLEFSVIE